MLYGMLRDDYLWLGRRPAGHRLVAYGAKLDRIDRFRQRAINWMFAGGAVTDLAFRVSVHARRPLGMSLSVTPLAICGAPELRLVSCFLHHRISSITAELVIGRVENVIPCSNRQDQESGEQ
jgi:hypothetical protein